MKSKIAGTLLFIFLLLREGSILITRISFIFFIGAVSALIAGKFLMALVLALLPFSHYLFRYLFGVVVMWTGLLQNTEKT